MALHGKNRVLTLPALGGRGGYCCPDHQGSSRLGPSEKGTVTHWSRYWERDTLTWARPRGIQPLVASLGRSSADLGPVGRGAQPLVANLPGVPLTCAHRVPRPLTVPSVRCQTWAHWQQGPRLWPSNSTVGLLIMGSGH